MKQTLLKKLYVTLAYFTRKYLEKSDALIIGITGSVGKTSCRVILTQVLRAIENEKYSVKTTSNNYQERLDEISQNLENTIYTSPKNFNSEIGLMLSIFQIEEYSSSFFGLFKASFTIISKSLSEKPWYKIIVLEYGIDHPVDMDFLLTIAKPDIAIFTKLDKVHSAYFDSVEAIGDEKFKLMLSAKKQVYLNYLDEYCKNNASKIKVPTKFYFGGDVDVKNFEITEKNGDLSSNFVYENQKIITNLFGEENMNYIALSMDIANSIIGKVEKEKGINFDLDLQPGRFSLLTGINKSILIDSTYNASPESMKKMIQNTFYLRDNAFKNYKIGFVVGDMRELGSNSYSSHEELASYLFNADFVYTVGVETKNYLLPELNGKIKILKNFTYSKDAGIDLKEFLLKSNDKYIILFKGSQNTIYTEEALKQVLVNDEDKNNLVRQDPEWMKKKSV